MEVWKPVLGYAGHYEVSDLGRVRSLKRDRILAQVETRRGYIQLNLYRDGLVRNKLVHRLVAEAFLGPIPLGMQVNHLDADKTNNTLTNLEVVTAEENRQHARALGRVRHRHGEANPHAKLDSTKVKDIRRLRVEGQRVEAIARLYDVTARSIYAILRGETWRHVR